MTKRLALTALFCALLVAGGVALVASKSLAPTRTGTPAFVEVKWPFPMDSRSASSSLFRSTD